MIRNPFGGIRFGASAGSINLASNYFWTSIDSFWHSAKPHLKLTNYICANVEVSFEHEKSYELNATKGCKAEIDADFIMD